jgi:3-deoxy-D-manno-octulosonate 8-phosphate phosphatase KdsC-like HAD superfamily phosphatase
VEYRKGDVPILEILPIDDVLTDSVNYLLQLKTTMKKYFKIRDRMTITLNIQQEQAIQNAIRAGQVKSIEEFIDRAISELGVQSKSSSVSNSFEQGLGLFGSDEDSALLDDVVTMAYEERRHPSKESSLL